jgi:hypothetical protein
MAVCRRRVFWRIATLLSALALAIIVAIPAHADAPVGRPWRGPLYRTTAELLCVESRGAEVVVTIDNRGSRPVVLAGEIALTFTWARSPQPPAQFEARIPVDPAARIIPPRQSRAYRIRLPDAALPADPAIDFRQPVWLRAHIYLAGLRLPAMRTFAFTGCQPPPPGDELRGGILATFVVAGETFRVWVTNDTTIQQILDLQAGTSQASIPVGRVRYGPGPGDHNLPWSWHLDPQEIEMAEATIELCDGRPSDLEANPQEWIETVGSYCPWGAELVSVEDRRELGSTVRWLQLSRR